MSFRSLNEGVNDGDPDAVIRTHKSAIRVSSVCRLHALNAITLSRCAEWFFHRPIRPEMSSSETRRQFNSPGKRSIQEGIRPRRCLRHYWWRCRGGRKQAGGQAGGSEPESVAAITSCRASSYSVSVFHRCFKAARSGRSGSVGQLDRKKSASLPELLLADRDASLLLLRVDQPFRGKED